MFIEKNKIVVQKVAEKTCSVFEIDPFKAISEGTLIATVKPSKAGVVVKALKRAGIPASVVGEVKPKKYGVKVREGGRTRKLEHPKLDPFWVKFEEYLVKQQKRKQGKCAESVEVVELSDAVKQLVSLKKFGGLVPEVGSNFVYACAKARSPKEVAGVEGRIRRGKNRLVAGNVVFGASRHAASVVLEAMRFSPSTRSALNLAYFLRLKRVFKRARLKTIEVSRNAEPRRVRVREGASQPWLLREAVRKNRGQVPDVVFHESILGKEGIALVLGKTPLDVLKKTKKVLKAF